MASDSCKILVSLSFSELDQKWNEFLSYLWINVGNINSAIRLKIISLQERETKWNFTGCRVPHFMIVRIYTIYQIIKSLLDNKMFIFEEYGTFKHTT